MFHTFFIRFTVDLAFNSYLISHLKFNMHKLHYTKYIIQNTNIHKLIRVSIVINYHKLYQQISYYELKKFQFTFLNG